MSQHSSLGLKDALIKFSLILTEISSHQARGGAGGMLNEPSSAFWSVTGIILSTMTVFKIFKDYYLVLSNVSLFKHTFLKVVFFFLK